MESVTVPVIVADRICAAADAGRRRSRAKRNTPRRTRWLVCTTTSLVNARRDSPPAGVAYSEMNWCAES